MFRRTKILATLGPSTDDPKVLDKVIEAGIDVARINFAHGKSEEHLSRAEKLRSRARSHGHQVGILADLQGPKIRIERFKNGPAELVEGEQFIFDAALEKTKGDQHRVGISYK